MAIHEKRYETYWRTRQLCESGSQGTRLPGDLYETVDTALAKNGKKLLDVGCGNGILMEMVKDRAEDVYGCDISETATRAALSREMMSVCADLNSGYLPYRNDSFEIITCIEVIEHILDPLKLLKELYRILCTNGYLVLTTPNIRYFKHLSTLLFKGTFPHTTTDTFVWGGGHLHYFTRNDLTFLLKRAGFRKPRFLINHQQFARSAKRLFFYKLLGESIFGEWFCGGIILKAIKE